MRTLRRFPKLFNFLVIGSFIYSLGACLFYPYLSLYIQRRLDIPLRYTSLLISLRALASVAASLFAGQLADRFGRKKIMLISLAGIALYHFGMKSADTVWEFAILLTLFGMCDLGYPVALNTMVADIVPIEDRLDAFSLIRVVENVGAALGPIVGGYLIARSYDRLFNAAFIGLMVALVFAWIFCKETLRKDFSESEPSESRDLRVVFCNRPFTIAVILFCLVFVTCKSIFNLLSFYANAVHGIPEEKISYVYFVNGLMCTLLQLPVARKMKGKEPLRLMIIASLLNAFSVAGYELFHNVPWYCVCMFVMTLGELIMVPTMSDLTARIAPADARGRYMGFLNMAQPVGRGIASAFTGWVYDAIGPSYVWPVTGLFALVAAGGYYLLKKKSDLR